MHSLIALVTIAFLESYVKSYSYGFSKSSITRVDDVRGDSIGRKYRRCRFLELSSTFENFIILGGSGDLATTKIIPGLFHLCKQYSTLNENRNVLTTNNQETLTLQTRIPYLSRHFTYKDFTVKLAARSDWSDDFLRKKLEIVLLNENKDRTPKGQAFHGKLVEEFLGKCFYTRVDSYDVEEMSQLMSTIKEDEKEKEKNNINSNKNYNNNVDSNNKENLDEIDINSNNNDNNNNNDENGDNSENDVSDSTRNIVYFALPPKQYLPALHSIRSILTLSEKIPKNLKISRISKNIVDVILEKPIGYDSKTALEITELALLAVNNLGENLWCVDHYLAKDLATAIIPLKTSQNPLISRLFHDYLNSNYISKLDVIFSDTSILDGRSGYFDDCGIVRDILQNHLIQLLALLCCDTELDPRFFFEYFNSSNSVNNVNKNENENRNKNHRNDDNNNDIDNNNNNNNNDNNNIKNNWKLLSPENKSKIISEKRSEILSTIPALLPSELTVGQYDSYKTEKGVKMGSKTSTFASSKIQVPGPVWGNTTFYLIAGKGLDSKESMIRISYRREHFKAVLSCVRDIVSTVRSDADFLSDDISRLESLTLVLQVQPKPGIYLEQVLSQFPVEAKDGNQIENVAPKTTKNLILSIEDLPNWCDIDLPNEVISTSENNENGPTTVNKSLDWTMDAYTRVLDSILFRERKNEFFPSVHEIMTQWKIFSNALKTIEESLLDEKEEKKEKIEKKRNVFDTNDGILSVEEMETETRTYSDEMVLRSYSIGSSIKSIMENKM